MGVGAGGWRRWAFTLVDLNFPEPEPCVWAEPLNSRTADSRICTHAGLTAGCGRPLLSPSGLAAKPGEPLPTIQTLLGLSHRQKGEGYQSVALCGMFRIEGGDHSLLRVCANEWDWPS